MVLLNAMPFGVIFVTLPPSGPPFLTKLTSNMQWLILSTLPLNPYSARSFGAGSRPGHIAFLDRAVATVQLRHTIHVFCLFGEEFSTAISVGLFHTFSPELWFFQNNCPVAGWRTSVHPSRRGAGAADSVAASVSLAAAEAEVDEVDEEDEEEEARCADSGFHSPPLEMSIVSLH